MTDKLQRDIERGERARMLTGDPLITEAQEHIEAELWRLFRETKPDDAKTLAQIAAMRYFHGKYFAYFQQAITNGKLASINLESKRRPLKERLFG